MSLPSCLMPRDNQHLSSSQLAGLAEVSLTSLSSRSHRPATLLPAPRHQPGGAVLHLFRASEPRGQAASACSWRGPPRCGVTGSRGRGGNFGRFGAVEMGLGRANSL